MVQKGLGIVTVSLSYLYQVKNLVDRGDFNLTCSFDEEFFILALVDGEHLFTDGLAVARQQVGDHLIINLDVRQFDLELDDIVQAPLGYLCLTHLVEQVLHRKDEHT